MMRNVTYEPSLQSTSKNHLQNSWGLKGNEVEKQQ